MRACTGTGLIATLHRLTYRAGKHTRKWVAGNTICALLLIGVAVFTYIATQPLAHSLRTIAESVTALTIAPGAAGTTGALVLSGLLEEEDGRTPPVLLPIMAEGVRHFDLLSVCPGTIASVLMFLSARFARFSYGRFSCFPGYFSTCSVSSKALLAPSWLLLLFTLLWSLGMIVGAILSSGADSMLTVVLIRQFTPMCNSNHTSSHAMHDAVATATQGFASADSALQANPSSAWRTQGKIQAAAALAASKAQLADFTRLCESLEAIPADMRGLLGAGVCGTLAALAALVCVSGLCCAKGCCFGCRKALRCCCLWRATKAQKDAKRARRAQAREQKEVQKEEARYERELERKRRSARVAPEGGKYLAAFQRRSTAPPSQAAKYRVPVPVSLPAVSLPTFTPVKDFKPLGNKAAVEEMRLDDIA